MTISYTNTWRDLLTFNRQHIWRSPVSIAIHLGGVAFLAYVFFQAAEPGPAPSYGLAARIVGTVLFMALALPVLTAVQLAIVVLLLLSRRNKTLFAKQTLTLREDGFDTENAYARSDCKWTVVQKLRQTRRHLFIYVSQNGALIVPRRAFRDEAEWQAFHEFCQRRTAACAGDAGEATLKPR